MKNLTLAVILLLSCFTAVADSWLPPKVKEYYSSDSSYYVRVVPREVPEKYWDWVEASPKKKKKFSPRDTTIVHCHAKMFKKTIDGDSLIWNEKLINQIAPVDALVSDDGKYFVTFDNWHSVGYGLDVLVIYNDKGMLLKRHMLEDISPFPINTYERSISSLWWRCGEQFLGNNQLEICFSKEDNASERRIYDMAELKIE